VDYVGEVVDDHTAEQLSLAYRAVNQFPELIKRHRRFVGGAAATAVISTTAIVLAYRAMHARTSRGESSVDALKRITEDEIERAGSLLKRVRKHKK
jgi:hypothetical protein